MKIIRYLAKKTSKQISYGFLVNKDLVISLNQALNHFSLITKPLSFATICDLCYHHNLDSSVLDEIVSALTLNEVTLLAPIDQVKTLRAFNTFEKQAIALSKLKGTNLPIEWYDSPVFYFSNPNTFYGPNEMIPIPFPSNELDYELEVAFIIGKSGKNIPSNKAQDHLFGLTILNDWSARDLLREEMKMNLGPAKGKDFAKSIGPWIVTIDEFPEFLQSGKFDVSMKAYIDDKQASSGNLKDMYFSINQMIEIASRNAWLYPGDILSSGAVSTGSLLQQQQSKFSSYLEVGNEIRLEVNRLGVLTNRIIPSDIRYKTQME